MGHSPHSLTSGPFCYCTQATKNMRVAKKYAHAGARTHDRALISLCFDHWARKRLLVLYSMPLFLIYQIQNSLTSGPTPPPLYPLLLSIIHSTHSSYPPPASPSPPSTATHSSIDSDGDGLLRYESADSFLFLFLLIRLGFRGTD